MTWLEAAESGCLDDDVEDDDDAANTARHCLWSTLSPDRKQRVTSIQACEWNTACRRNTRQGRRVTVWLAVGMARVGLGLNHGLLRHSGTGPHAGKRQQDNNNVYRLYGVFEEDCVSLFECLTIHPMRTVCPHIFSPQTLPLHVRHRSFHPSLPPVVPPRHFPATSYAPRTHALRTTCVTLIYRTVLRCLDLQFRLYIHS